MYGAAITCYVHTDTYASTEVLAKPVTQITAIAKRQVAILT